MSETEVELLISLAKQYFPAYCRDELVSNVYCSSVEKNKVITGDPRKVLLARLHYFFDRDFRYSGKLVQLSFDAPDRSVEDRQKLSSEEINEIILAIEEPFSTILRLRMNGLTFEAIGKNFDMSRGEAFKNFERACKKARKWLQINRPEVEYDV